jgi:hypothetical protein
LVVVTSKEMEADRLAELGGKGEETFGAFVMVGEATPADGA